MNKFFVAVLVLSLLIPTNCFAGLRKESFNVCGKFQRCELIQVQSQPVQVQQQTPVYFYTQPYMYYGSGPIYSGGCTSGNCGSR